jgi:hypothetical protein
MLLSIAAPWAMLPFVACGGPLLLAGPLLLSAFIALGYSADFQPVQRSSNWAQFGAAAGLWLLVNAGVLAFLVAVLSLLYSPR